MNLYRARNHLRTPDFDLDVLPGVKLSVSPGTARAGSVRVDCGNDVLMFWNGAVGVRPPPVGKATRPVPPGAERFFREAVAQDYIVATTVGPFPSLGHVYQMPDGYHWGSVEARSYKGTPRRRGEVYVEEADSVPIEEGARTKR